MSDPTERMRDMMSTEAFVRLFVESGGPLRPTRLLPRRQRLRLRLSGGKGRTVPPVSLCNFSHWRDESECAGVGTGGRPFVKAPSSRGAQMFLQWFVETQAFELFLQERVGALRQLAKTPQHHLLPKGFFERRANEYLLDLEQSGRGLREFGKKVKNIGPKDTPPPTRVETREERVERKNYDTSESKLRREFEVFGSIKKIVIVHNKITGKPRGYAFVEYEHERDMHSAYKHADGKKIDGRRVLVDVERGRTVKGWLPRRLGGGLGGTRRGGPDVNTKHSGREDSRLDDRYMWVSLAALFGTGTVVTGTSGCRAASGPERERRRSRSRDRDRDRGDRGDRRRRSSKDRKRERRRDRPERDRSDRPERSERPERGDRDRTDRGDRSERPDDVAGGDEAPREKRRRSRSRDRAKRKRSRSRSREHKRRERRSDRNGAERGPDGIKTEPTDQDGFGDRDSRTENYDSAGAGDFGGGGYNSESQGSYPKIERGEEYN
ncbi:hypothetical protein HPB47_025299 [Ixodes persulcatus]|uniref:Uncharacterized protein n=1 Tax=Ixodes persulcatus TaxID=34615 RepID=A0AC60Q263_IXOPE|nr:hypothetical protein HPB47_025299 [Ixodes persulcatus]